jgi:hypothetical protein
VEDAASGRWRVNWIGFRNIGEKKAPHLAFGTSKLWSQQTIQDSTYLKNDIFTQDGDFKEMPTYLSSLTGDRNMHTLWGTSAIYASSLDHFTIYLRPKPGTSLSIRNAQQWSYQVNWVGLGHVYLKHMRFGWIDNWVEDPDSGGTRAHADAPPGLHTHPSRPMCARARTHAPRRARAHARTTQMRVHGSGLPYHASAITHCHFTRLRAGAGIQIHVKFYKPFTSTPKIITTIQGKVLLWPPDR